MPLYPLGRAGGEACAAPVTLTRISGRRWVDGWTDGRKYTASVQANLSDVAAS